MKFALIGAGDRGIIYSHYVQDILGHEIAAVADCSQARLEMAREYFKISAGMCFTEGIELIDAAPDIDALIIASMDRAH